MLHGVAGMLEGRDAIQRGFDRLERWACANLMMLKKATCKVLHIGWGSPKHKRRLGRNESTIALWRKTWGCLCMKSSI